MSFNSKIEIYNAITNTFVAALEKRYFIPTNIDSNFEMIELFSKKDQNFINSKLNGPFEPTMDIYEKQPEITLNKKNITTKEAEDILKSHTHDHNPKSDKDKNVKKSKIKKKSKKK